MSLTTPILYSIPAFDASQPQVFTFYSVGGNQVTGNILTIKNNATLATVYSQQQNTYKFEHTLPAGTLTNGTYYQATLQTVDAQNNKSNASAPIQFYCYTQPSFTISNMPVGNIITNSSFAFSITYNQEQGETLNAYVFNLYNAGGALISTSNTSYNSSTTLPFTGTYLFSGFEDKSTYFIEVNGVTSGGTQITTGRIKFTTNYSTFNTFSYLFLTNNCSGGYITIESNIVGIDDITNPQNPTYIDNKEIDLRKDGYYVKWVDGYIISGNWTMRMWGRQFTPDKEIVRFSNTDGDIVSIYYRQTTTQAYFEMRCVNKNFIWGYTIESQYISPPADNEQVFCWLRKIDNLYELKIENRGVEA